jgi:hypothetical protein
MIKVFSNTRDGINRGKDGLLIKDFTYYLILRLVAGGEALRALTIMYSPLKWKLNM